MSTHAEIAVLVDTSTSWGVGIIRGVVKYAREHGEWTYFLEPRGKYEPLHLPDQWAGDGVIARVWTEEFARELAESNIPAVNVSFTRFSAPQLAHCSVDQPMIGKMAAEHLLERGFEHFAYCGATHDRPEYVDEVRQGYVDELQRRQFLPVDLRAPVLGQSGKTWRQILGRIAEQIDPLPKPLGVLAWDDTRARHITEACRMASINVPEEVAVIGVDDDEVMGLVSNPPLSSVHLPAEAVGFEAAAILDRMMAGGAVPSEPVLLEPLGVVTRQSTDTTAINDPDVAAALSLIRQHASEGIEVKDILKQVPVSRRALEARFKEFLGRGPAAELRRVRMGIAKDLLATTEHSLPKVANYSGFTSADVMLRTFQRELGLSPSVFRKRYRK